MSDDKFIIWKRWVQDFIYEYVTSSNKKRKRIMILISRHPYLPIYLVKKYQNLYWDRISISRSNDTLIKKNFIHFQGSRRFSFIDWEKHPKGIIRLTYHPQLSIALVLRYHWIGWDFKFLLLYRKWSIKQIQKLIQKRKMDWCVYSKNPFITIETIRHFLRYPWDWTTLAIHPSCPPQDIYHDNILFGKWKWRSVFRNPRISYDFWKDFVENHPNVYKDKYILLHNHFQYDSSLQSWATFHIHEFMILHFITKPMILKKLKLLLYLKHKMVPDLLNYTLSFV
jgi:hypothetical protein